MSVERAAKVCDLAISEQRKYEWYIILNDIVCKREHVEIVCMHWEDSQTYYYYYYYYRVSSIPFRYGKVAKDKERWRTDWEYVMYKINIKLYINVILGIKRTLRLASLHISPSWHGHTVHHKTISSSVNLRTLNEIKHISVRVLINSIQIFARILPKFIYSSLGITLAHAKAKNWLT